MDFTYFGDGAAVLLSGAVAYGSASTDASPPVSAEVLVQAAIPEALHIDRKNPSDVEVFRLTIKQGRSTVWHSHSGSVLVSVKRGTAAVYRADGTRCARTAHEAGGAFLESPRQVHTIRNEGRGKLVLYAVSMLPKGSDPGKEEAAPAGCAFK